MITVGKGTRSAALFAGVTLALCETAALGSVGGRPADFTLRAVAGTAWQGTFRLANHLGKQPVVIAFFATWCRPCEVELPALEKLRGTLGGKVVMAAISTDGPESAAQIAATARRLRLGFPVLHDADSSVTARYNPRRAVPFLIVIDRAGRIVTEKEGWTPADEAALARDLARLVGP